MRYSGNELRSAYHLSPKVLWESLTSVASNQKLPIAQAEDFAATSLVLKQVGKAGRS